MMFKSAKKHFLILLCRNQSRLANDGATTKWIFHDVKDCSSLFNRTDYPHTNQLLDATKTKFGFKTLRPHQLEAINAALLGHNCFILMPTGGGKSLCFQLPAVLTHRVTIVVSPLKSLILDQVYKLNRLNIPAAHLLTTIDDITNEELVYSDLYKKEPDLRLVYVTPEKLGVNKKLREMLKHLYDRDLIERLAIDEAHCVSMWGHNFRKNYKLIGEIHTELFPTVPIMLLTATATPRVRKDILLQMNFSIETDNISLGSPIDAQKTTIEFTPPDKKNYAFFIRSFLRSNLKYTVYRKECDKDVLEKIEKIILNNHMDQCGIIYCISRQRTEEVAEYLREKELNAIAYHAGLGDSLRNEIQLKWSTGVCNIVCATIAFGMGIDKPNVRFVIHEALPKSLESFYQESGRAGRDGLTASSILFFNYRDLDKWKYLFYRNLRHSETKIYEQSLEDVYRMMQYCDNSIDCRNFQLLEYFGEKFDRNECMHSRETICDNCSAYKSKVFEIKEITTIAITIVDCVKLTKVERLSVSMLSDILRGINNLHVKDDLLESQSFGKLAVYNKLFVERVIYKLIYNGYLKEVCKLVDLKRSKTVETTIIVGPKADELLKGKVKIEIDINYKTTLMQKKENKYSKNSKAKNYKNDKMKDFKDDKIKDFKSTKMEEFKNAKIEDFKNDKNYIPLDELF